MTDTPFADAALDYHRHGWCPIPVIGKSDIPTGVTGRDGIDFSAADLVDLAERMGDRNVATRAPDGVIGIDIDAYDDKQGADTFTKAHALWGSLPRTVRSTARAAQDRLSGIYWYRVPYGYEASGNLALEGTADIEIIQRSHRYAVLPPSTHPKTGAEYQWWWTTGEPCDEIPTVDELPMLPDAWLEGLASVNVATVERDPIEVAPQHAPIDQWHDRVRQVYDQLVMIAGSKAGSRHDTMVKTQAALCRMEADGLTGATTALEQAERVWAEAMTDDRGQQEALDEWHRAIDGARQKVASTVLGLPSMGEPIPPDLYDRRPVLSQVRQAAHSRGLPADAVLGCVLARMAYLTPPQLQLPPIVGSNGSLDVIHAIVAPSGFGKSQSLSCAKELLPGPDSDRDGMPIGSGEGMIEAYYDMVETEDEKGQKRKERQRAHQAVLFAVDEGQTLAELAQRSGSTLMTNLRSAWSGQNVGQTNATADRTRLMKANTYRFAMIVGIQPEKADALLGDAAGGTPQRFCWFSAADPTIPDPYEVGWPDWPGTLDWSRPPQPSFGPWLMNVHDEIRKEVVIARHVLVTTGQATLEAHAHLLRLKLAGLLALLEGRTDITLDDWDIANQIHEASKATRDGMQTAIRNEQAAKARARGAALAAEAEHYDEHTEARAVVVMAKAIARKAHRLGHMKKADATRATTAKYRALVSVDDALDHGATEGWIVVDEDGIRPGETLPPA